MPSRTQAYDEATINYPVGDASVPAVIYHPRHLTGPAPAVVFLPGSGDEIGTMEFLPQACARHGYVTLATGYRGTNWDHDDDDAIGAVDYLQTLPDVDAHRIAMVGHFRGGSAALRTTAQDRRVRTVVALAAPVFLAQWVNGVRSLSELNYQDRVAMLGGAPDDQAQRYARLSPLFAARAIKAPVLLIQGAADLFVPLDHAVWMYVQLGHAGNPNIRLELTPWAGHYFDDVLSGQWTEDEGLSGSFHEHVATMTVGWLDDTLGV